MQAGVDTSQGLHDWNCAFTQFLALPSFVLQGANNTQNYSETWPRTCSAISHEAVRYEELSSQ